MNHVIHQGAVYVQAADPQKDREFRQQALEAWDKMLEYLREYRATPYYGKYLVWFERFMPEYKWLLLSVGPKRSDGTKGAFGPAMFPRAEYAIELFVLDDDFWEYEDERQQEELVWALNNKDVRSTFVHEFIHYLDRKRRGEQELSSKELEQRAKRKTDPGAYFSNAEEFNAWYQALANLVDEEFKEGVQNWGEKTIHKQKWLEEKLGDYKSFFAFVNYINNWEGHNWPLEKLEQKWQRKLTKRLYGLWNDLKEQYLP